MNDSWNSSLWKHRFPWSILWDRSTRSGTLLTESRSEEKELSIRSFIPIPSPAATETSAMTEHFSSPVHSQPCYLQLSYSQNFCDSGWLPLHFPRVSLVQSVILDSPSPQECTGLIRTALYLQRRWAVACSGTQCHVWHTGTSPKGPPSSNCVEAL